MQKETNMAVARRMTCKIGLIWRHMKTLYKKNIWTSQKFYKNSQQEEFQFSNFSSWKTTKEV